MIRFPAEWEPQAAVVIAWPHHSGDFIDLDSVETSYRIIAETISAIQALLIVCKDLEHQQRIQQQLKTSHNIYFIHADYNDIWLRDTVFLTVEWDSPKAKQQLLNLRFNGWGNKYPHDADDALNLTLFKHPIFKGLPTATLDFVLEGGSIETDGAGTLLTTRNCLLNPNRNPQLSEQQITEQLQQLLGVQRILWVEQERLAGDDTDAHIDTLVRFCSVDTMAYCACDDEADPHYAGLKNMEAQLQQFRMLNGAPYQLIPLPLPQPIYDEAGQQLPANYANFLIINGAVLVPIYDDPMDAVAEQRLASGFPQHQIITIPCRPLVQQYGSLHCMSMQIPAIAPLHL